METLTQWDTDITTAVNFSNRRAHCFRAFKYIVMLRPWTTQSTQDHPPS